jgi:hypothetical protein
VKAPIVCPPGATEEPDCCAPAGTDLETGRCPRSASPGQPVEWRTVAALVSGPVPPRQTLWMCRDPECEVVYFGDRGASFVQDELRVVPGFKAGSDGLVCYCFLHRRSAIEQEVEATGASAILERVTARVRARECACEVRNPSGRCCLGELQQHVRLALARSSDR